jgi:sugar (pentulose or hexulose) kinase
VVEGTTLNLGYGFSRMKSLGLRPEEVRATGGGARSQTWLQVLADVFESRAVTLKEPESAAYGAALQAIWCYLKDKNTKINLAGLTRQMVKKDTLAAVPDFKRSDFYRELQVRFNSLWQRLAPEFKEHS